MQRCMNKKVENLRKKFYEATLGWEYRERERNSRVDQEVLIKQCVFQITINTNKFTKVTYFYHHSKVVLPKIGVGLAVLQSWLVKTRCINARPIPRLTLEDLS